MVSSSSPTPDAPRQDSTDAPQPYGPVADAVAPRLFDAHHVWITIGALALVFLGAFESMAVTTIMPVVSADLDGESLYALAFAGPLATGVIGMVIAGNWSDRSGPAGALYTAGTLFVVGLLISGLSTDMPTFLLGRLAQGFGSGAITVALYVVVARALPAALHPKIFAGFATAWVVPSLVGPTIAGSVTDLWSWHWVFLGVVVLVLAAVALIVPTLRRLPSVTHDAQRPRWELGRWGWAALAAIAVLALNIAGDAGPWGPLYALGALAVGLVAVRPLLPRGTLRMRRGLPSVIALRGLVGAAFFATEVYIPYLLVTDYGFTPTLAGLALTGGALTWAVGSNLQGRLGHSLPDIVFVRIGTAVAFVAIGLVLLCTALGLSPALIIAAWVIGGAGMGFVFPRFGVMTLAQSSIADQGFNSAALSISDSFGSALAIAVAGVLFGLATGGVWPFVFVFIFTSAIALATVLFGPRIVPARSA